MLANPLLMCLCNSQVLDVNTVVHNSIGSMGVLVLFVVLSLAIYIYLTTTTGHLGRGDFS